MASSYALPQSSQGDHSDHTKLNGTIHDARHHDHNSWLQHSNTAALKESTRPAHDLDHAHSHHHEHHHNLSSRSDGFVDKLPMLGKSRARARGESDLSRQQDVKVEYRVSGSSRTSGSLASSHLLSELGTGVLVALIFFLPALVPLAHFETTHEHGHHVHMPADGHNELEHLREDMLDLDGPPMNPAWSLMLGLPESFALAAIVLLFQALTAFYTTHNSAVPSSSTYASTRMPTNDRSSSRSSHSQEQLNLGTTAILRALAYFLPIFASFKISGWRVSMVVLTAFASGCGIPGRPLGTLDRAVLLPIALPILVCILLDLLQITADAGRAHIICGYVALLAALVILPDQAVTSNDDEQPASRARRGTLWSTMSQSKFVNLPTASDNPRIQNAAASLVGGVICAVASVAIFAALQLVPDLSLSWILACGAFVIVSVASTCFAAPQLLQSERKAGYVLGMIMVIILGLFTSPVDLYGLSSNTSLTALHILATFFAAKSLPKSHTIATAHKHNVHAGEKHDRHSPLTTWLLKSIDPDSLLHSILHEKDSRRIAYFTCLNFAFMLVQGLYGHLSGSLGLLSDTVHMFFDCLGLIVGLGAAIASRWPPSRDRPYGWGKLNTLAGFGNGVFLMLVSFEFVWEAIEGILEGRELRRVKELFVVSSLGLLVNLVGLFAFGHAHAGHDHSHGHSHHSHAHDSHDGHGHHHSHDDHNDNMHGIFLHVAADAGGSLAVIISTALTLWRPWYLWDPLATIIIATLIFAAAVPLVISSGQKLLLIVPEDTEYLIKNFLQEVGELRGVLGYAEPRFWAMDREDTAQNQDHHVQDHHEHQHDDLQHQHDHYHDHKTEHIHNDHDHTHIHSHKAAGPAMSVTGSLHVTVVQSALLEDVRARVQEMAAANGIDVIVHVEHAASSMNGSAVME